MSRLLGSVMVGASGLYQSIQLPWRTVHVDRSKVPVSDSAASTCSRVEHPSVVVQYWGYAATVHKNQGATCDRAHLLARDRTYREIGYVGLSRGRESNRIWTVSDHDLLPTDNVAHGAESDVAADPLADLRRAMQHSAAQRLATDQDDELEPAGIDL